MRLGPTSTTPTSIGSMRRRRAAGRPLLPVRAFKGEPGVAQAFLSDRYSVIDNLDVLTATLDGSARPVSMSASTGATQTDRRMYVRSSPRGEGHGGATPGTTATRSAAASQQWREVADREPRLRRRHRAGHLRRLPDLQLGDRMRGHDDHPTSSSRSARTADADAGRAALHPCRCSYGRGRHRLVPRHAAQEPRPQ